MVTTLTCRSATGTLLSQATRPASRRVLRQFFSSLAPIRYVRGGVTQVDVDRFERFVIPRHGEQMLRKGWHAPRLERLKPLELFCGDDHHGWDAALGDELGLAALRCLDQGAEVTFRVVQRPCLHDPSFRG